MPDPARPVRVRIAPSPTGNCHVGTARGALYNLLFARRRGGAFILRIDDTDARRSTLESEQGVLEGLRWLGLDWDEGPDTGGPYGPYRQSERLEWYRESARRLLDTGRAYYCFCTPEELAAERQAAQAAGRPGRYSGRCRDLDEGEVKARLAQGLTPVIRLRLEPRAYRYVDLVQGPIQQDGALLGDPVIVRADGLPTYNYATVVDDDGMRISHVLRGAEHINNTFVQLQVYAALGVEPPEFAHLGLLLKMAEMLNRAPVLEEVLTSLMDASIQLGDAERGLLFLRGHDPAASRAAPQGPLAPLRRARAVGPWYRRALPGDRRLSRDAPCEA